MNNNYHDQTEHPLSHLLSYTVTCSYSQFTHLSNTSCCSWSCTHVSSCSPNPSISGPSGGSILEMFTLLILLLASSTVRLHAGRCLDLRLISLYENYTEKQEIAYVHNYLLCVDRPKSSVRAGFALSGGQNFLPSVDKMHVACYGLISYTSPPGGRIPQMHSIRIIIGLVLAPSYSRE